MVMNNKKGQLNGAMVYGAITLVVTLAIGAIVLGSMATNWTNTYGNVNNSVQNVTRDGLALTTQYASLLPTVGIVLVAIMILGLVAGGLGAFR